MKKAFNLILLATCITAVGTSLVQSQNVGIGTINPKARLHVLDSSVVFSATGDVAGNQGTPPVSGAGRRMMWYPDKAAFRVGYIGGTQWDKANIGNYSFASGFGTIASGQYAVAFGESTTASGDKAFAVGDGTIASGSRAVAMGYSTQATSSGSTALGYLSVATGSYATAIGFQALATGSAATAAGYVSNATGNYASSIGFRVTASGDYSSALGSYVSSNQHDGSFLIGDHSTTVTMSSPADNNFRARFANGYRFYTSSDLSTSSALAAGDNAWSTSSDSTKKENLQKADGETTLQKIASFNLGSWNYKGQDPKIFRHYGPMAQEFYAAFGNDHFGSIGNDTTINQADFDGINLIAIAALEKRTQKIEHLQKENDALKQEVALLAQKLEDQQTAMAKRLAMLETLVFDEKQPNHKMAKK